MSKPMVYVTRLIPQIGIDLLQAECHVEINPHDRPLTRQELWENVQGCDGILCLVRIKLTRSV
jgi:hypothetical protein